MFGKKPTRLPARRAKCGCVVQIVKPCSLHAARPKVTEVKEQPKEAARPIDWSPYYFTTDCYVKKRRELPDNYKFSNDAEKKAWRESLDLCACGKHSMILLGGDGKPVGLLGGSQIGGMVHRPLVCSPFPLHRKLNPPKPGQAIRDVDPGMLRMS